ncbi:MAG: hypothetical protein ACKVVT_12555 [Dehalococcoidia bacterium]
MRKFFAGGAAVAAAGILLFGGVFAWRTSDSARGAALVGSNVFQIKYEPNCTATIDEALAHPDEGVDAIPCLTLIGPNGSVNIVGKGIGVNEGDFKLAVVDGSLKVRAVHRPDAGCKPEHFAGDVRILSPGEIIPPGGSGGPFAAYIKVLSDAPAECQGQIVYYRVTIEAENPNAATDPTLAVAP